MNPHHCPRPGCWRLEHDGPHSFEWVATYDAGTRAQFTAETAAAAWRRAERIGRAELLAVVTVEELAEHDRRTTLELAAELEQIGAYITGSQR